MAYIRVDQEMPAFDGQALTFKSPASCAGVEGLKVYYPAADGTETSATFALADAHGNNVGGIGLFGENVLVKVILDLDSNLAFVQNADTNAYLEGRFEELEKNSLSKDEAVLREPGEAMDLEFTKDFLYANISGRPVSGSMTVRGLYDGGDIIFASVGGSTSNHPTTVLYSEDDGLHWYPTDIPPASFSNDQRTNKWIVASGNGVHIAVITNLTTNTGYRSTDGKTWTAFQFAASVAFWGLAYGAAGFVVTTSTATGYISTDGITWNAISTPVTGARLAYGNGVYVGTGGNAPVMHSTDGINWQTTTLSNTMNHPDGFKFINGYFVGVHTYGSGDDAKAVIMRSSNGASWSYSTFKEMSNTPGVVDYVNGTYYLHREETAYSTYATSKNLSSWTLVSTHSTTGPNMINLLTATLQRGDITLAAYDGSGITVSGAGIEEGVGRLVGNGGELVGSGMRMEVIKFTGDGGSGARCIQCSFTPKIVIWTTYPTSYQADKNTHISLGAFNMNINGGYAGSSTSTSAGLFMRGVDCFYATSNATGYEYRAIVLG